MALITKDANASPDASTAMFAAQIPDAVAGEDLTVCSAAFLNGADGLVYMASGAAAGAKVHGFVPRNVKRGQPVTLLGPGTRFRGAAAGLQPGQPVYLGATKGTLDTAPTAGDAVGIAFAMSPTDIIFARYAI